MTKLRWLLHVFEREKEPSPEACERLQTAIEAEMAKDMLDAGMVSRTLLSQLEEPDPRAEARLQHEICQIPFQEEARRRPARRYQLSLALASAASLALLLAVGLPRLLTPQSQQLATQLDTQDDTPSVARFEGVYLAYNGGFGELGGTTSTPEIRWMSGRLDVEVEPDRGIALSVRTREAQVKVVGTRFAVIRDGFDTRVEVNRGQVEVTCTDEEPRLLEAGEALSCMSDSPALILHRAQTLRSQGASPEEVLAAIERGLERTEPGGAIWSNLTVLRMQCLADAGGTERALAEAHAYLDAAHARRRDEVLRLALLLAPDSCSLAMEHEQALAAPEAAPYDLVRLSDCLSAQRPAEARLLLERAQAHPGLPLQERGHVTSRLEALR